MVGTVSQLHALKRIYAVGFSRSLRIIGEDTPHRIGYCCQTRRYLLNAEEGILQFLGRLCLLGIVNVALQLHRQVVGGHAGQCVPGSSHSLGHVGLGVSEILSLVAEIVDPIVAKSETIGTGCSGVVSCL